MKILILNTSPRKHGTTAQILQKFQFFLNTYRDTDVRFINVSDLQLHPCTGCSKCFETGHCIFRDDLEHLSHQLADSDGIIIGSPTYACQISTQAKNVIDRTHLILEQALQKKYAIVLTTYENYGGHLSLQYLKRVFSLAGAYISDAFSVKNAFDANPFPNSLKEKDIQAIARKFHHHISIKKKYILPTLIHYFTFHIGIKPFVIKQGKRYAGVMNAWQRR